MGYQLYRNTTLGNSLQESIDELIQSQQTTPTCPPSSTSALNRCATQGSQPCWFKRLPWRYSSCLSGFPGVLFRQPDKAPSFLVH
ncbi:unnamed protein product [Nyctereutes procyonoides]|uniref:(raccoon dog) hypothetical protein n=1 Tax=Nyctereutes procyonoides TaxID=34880 RepID=A0A811YLH8_NYCPR|nr:unnamed protein product [Nyctereutes procyonoides]